MAGHPKFEQTWADLSARLDTTLTKRGIPPWLKEDVVQETGLRLLKVWDALDHSRPLLPLAYTIARNLVADEIRRNRNVDVGEEVDTASDEFVTERAGLARIELRRVEEALVSLTEKQRSVVLSDLGVAPPPKMGPDAIKMARMRARRSLLALLAGASRVHAGIVVDFKRVLRAVDAAFGGTRDGWATAAAGTLAAVAILATTWSVPPDVVRPPRGDGRASSPPMLSEAADAARAARSPAPASEQDTPPVAAVRGRSAPAVGNERAGAAAAEPRDPPALAVGGNEARVGAGVSVLGDGVHAGNEDQNDVVVCADPDTFYAGVIGDPTCAGSVLFAEGGGEVTTGN